MSARSTCTTYAFGGELEVLIEAGPYNTRTSPSKTLVDFPMHMSNMEDDIGFACGHNPF
jgi:hypothetical protein